MLGHFEFERRDVDDLTPTLIGGIDRFQRTAALPTLIDRVRHNVIGLLDHFQSRSPMPRLSPRLFPAELSQTFRLRLFQAIAGRGLAAVLAVFRQLSAQFVDLISQLFVLRFQNIDPVFQRLNSIPQKLQLGKETNDEFSFFIRGKFRDIRQTFDHLVNSLPDAPTEITKSSPYQSPVSSNVSCKNV